MRTWLNKTDVIALNFNWNLGCDCAEPRAHIQAETKNKLSMVMFSCVNVTTGGGCDSRSLRSRSDERVHVTLHLFVSLEVGKPSTWLRKWNEFDS